RPVPGRRGVLKFLEFPYLLRRWIGRAHLFWRCLFHYGNGHSSHRCTHAPSRPKFQSQRDSRQLLEGCLSVVLEPRGEALSSSSFAIDSENCRDKETPYSGVLPEGRWEPFLLL